MENFCKKEILGCFLEKKTHVMIQEKNVCITTLRMYGIFLSTINKGFKYIVVSRQVGIFIELCVTTCALNM